MDMLTDILRCPPLTPSTFLSSAVNTNVVSRLNRLQENIHTCTCTQHATIRTCTCTQHANIRTCTCTQHARLRFNFHCY